MLDDMKHLVLDILNVFVEQENFDWGSNCDYGRGRLNV